MQIVNKLNERNKVMVLTVYKVKIDRMTHARDANGTPKWSKETWCMF